MKKKHDKRPPPQSFHPSHYTRGFGPHGLSEVAGTLKKSYNDNSPHIIQFIEEHTDNSIQGTGREARGG